MRCSYNKQAVLLICRSAAFRKSIRQRLRHNEKVYESVHKFISPAFVSSNAEDAMNYNDCDVLWGKFAADIYKCNVWNLIFKALEGDHCLPQFIQSL